MTAGGTGCASKYFKQPDDTCLKVQALHRMSMRAANGARSHRCAPPGPWPTRGSTDLATDMTMSSGSTSAMDKSHSK